MNFSAAREPSREAHTPPVPSPLVLPVAGPFLIAHRAGNHLERLHAAELESPGALIEADVVFYRGRLEVRHPNRLRAPAAPWRARLLLSDLLAAAAPTTPLMLDLKGRHRRLAAAVIAALEPYLGKRPLTICARSWPLLERFEGLPVRRVHSVGTARQLRALIREASRERIEGVSIHERLLDLTAVTELRRVVGVVMTWPVNDLARATELVRLGVDGLISDKPGAISGLAPPEATA
jgi:hypothetical protein